MSPTQPDRVLAPARIGVSGARGFVGSHLVPHLERQGHEVRRLCRATAGANGGWAAQVGGLDAVIHLAGRAHRMHDDPVSAEAAYRAANLDLTIDLACAAAEAEVPRFVHVSTIKVLGDRSTRHRGLAPNDPLAPGDAYAASKADAETWLREDAAGLGLQTVIVRPPLVYGAGVKGNFLRLMQLARRRLPLPLAAVDAPRSLVYVGNLVDLLAKLAVSDRPIGGKVLHVTDGEALSSRDLLQRIGLAMGCEQRLWRLPLPLMRTIGRLLGRSADVDRLTMPMLVDDSATRDLCSWQPPVDVVSGLAATVAWFREAHA